MMRAIFLCERQDTVDRVFDEQTRSELRSRAQLTDRIYTKADLLADPDGFADVEFVFSTWGMPFLNEQEIKRCLPRLQCVFYGAGTVQGFARPFLACGVKVFSGKSGSTYVRTNDSNFRFNYVAFY